MDKLEKLGKWRLANGGVYPSGNYEICDFKQPSHKGMKYFEAEAINTNENT